MKNNNKNIHLFAIAALAATLMAGQVQVSTVYAEKTSVQMSSLIPDNVTIEEPVPLSEIALPDSEYGTLSWVDSSSVPSERVQSYDVVFQPYDSSMLSKISGWDGESDAIYSTVTVVVNSLTSDSEEKFDEDYDDSDANNDENQDNYDENQNSSEVTGDENKTDGEQSSEKESEATETPSEENKEESEVTETPSEEDEKESKEDKSDEEGSKKSDDDKTKTEDTEEVPTETPEVTEVPKATDTPKATETPEVTETPEATTTPAADKDNIFDGTDKDIKEDDRSTEFEDDLTDEQKEKLAEENHSANGITVSGIDLPYYVQFRVASGDDYEFTNASEANVFQSYEFELWDLKNNTEYEVPDGEYISVTVPVKAGYSYTIEHLLDSGAMETIVPSVDGSTMVFSTHSFSPFGIAGSKTLVGEEIEEDGYDTGAVTETPAAVQDADLTPVGDSATNTADSSNTATDSTTTASEVTSAPETSTEQTTANASSTDQNSEEDKSSSVKAVHTNDPTRILPFVVLAIAAAAIVGVIVYLRKRKK